MYHAIGFALLLAASLTFLVQVSGNDRARFYGITMTAAVSEIFFQLLMRNLNYMNSVVYNKIFAFDSDLRFDQLNPVPVQHNPRLAYEPNSLKRQIKKPYARIKSNAKRKSKRKLITSVSYECESVLAIRQY